MQNKNEEFLKQILFGGNLADKLTRMPLEIDSDSKSGNLAGTRVSQILMMDSLIDLKTPARTGKLSSEGSRIKGKSFFPKPSELKTPSNRGRLLHYFANHELLAIETMAFVLLRFPGADSIFRAGVLRTLQDEQRHLGQYLNRMRDFGVELGDFPLNLYFWNTLRQMSTPLDFVTQMSLTFEQANLDFALFYANLFQTEIGDPDTGKLLKDVHDDEIKHVAHGMKWFDEWRDASETEYESYSKLLPYPMTPRRARGGVFFAGTSRESAGMSKDFIESVRIAGGSRGKIPNYFFFNPQAELESTMPEIPRHLRNKINEMAPVLLWLAHEEDVVELPEIPGLSFLGQVHDVRGELPEIITQTPPAEKYAVFENFKPWGWSRSAWGKFSDLKSPVLHPPEFSKNTHSEKLFSKVFWQKQLKPFAQHSDQRESGQELPDANFLFEEILIKVDQSTSGRGHLRIPRERLQTPGIQSKLEKIKKRGGNYVVEPFYPKLHDFSIQYELAQSGKLIEFEPRFFHVDSLFQYQGAMIGRAVNNPYFEVSAIAVENKISEIKKAHSQVIEILKQEKYIGPFGIDALTYRGKNGEIEIAPVIEVNARYTMGRVAQEIERVVQGRKQRQGVFRVLTERELSHFSARTFAELERTLQSEYRENFMAVTPSSAKETWIFVVFGQNAVHRFLIPNSQWGPGSLVV